jgi:hypothetical protein
MAEMRRRNFRLAILSTKKDTGKLELLPELDGGRKDIGVESS